MAELLSLAGAIALLVVAYTLYQRQRERLLDEQTGSAGDDPIAASAALDEAIR
jgi:hypothetical protein